MRHKVRSLVEVKDDGVIYPPGNEFEMAEPLIVPHLRTGQIEYVGPGSAAKAKPAAPRKIE